MKRHAAALLGLLLLTGTGAYAATPTEIWASGSNTVSVTPDIATVNATIATNARDAASAVSQNNSRYDSAVAAIVRTGVARGDIALSYYNVNYVPKPPPQPNETPIQGTQWGYTVTRTFAVKVRVMTKAGSVVDAITNVDGATIGGVDFGVADPTKAQREAMIHAVRDARAQAETLATAAGLRIVGIKQITQGGAPVVQPMMRMSAMAPEPTNLDASSVSVREDVTIIYLASP